MSAENSPYSTVLNRLNNASEDHDFIRLFPSLHSQLLLGKYQVDGPLHSSGSEAVLYIAHDSEDHRFVIKLYRRRNGIKTGVIESLMRLENPHIGKILDAGEIYGYTFTVSPCYEGTSLDRILADGTRFDYSTLKHHIIPAVLDGLKALHDLGIIHKDLKPSNIMITPEDRGIRIIDFGVSSELDNFTLVITRTGKTPAYSAPETITGVFSPASDYFSFGITLFELMTGHTPFEYDPESRDEINRDIMIRKIEFPENFDPDIRNLILGLTFRDISGRHDLNNPNRRWGYEEVRRWLANEAVPVPGIFGYRTDLSSYSESDSLSDPDTERFTYPYRFSGSFLYTPAALAVTLLKNCEEGLSELQCGLLSRHYELNEDSELQEKCRRTAEIIDALKEGHPQITALFTGLCYSLCSSVKGIYWKHLYFRDIKDFANRVLDEIQSVQKKNHSAFLEPDRYRNTEFVKYLNEMITTSFLRDHASLFLDACGRSERKKIISLLDSVLNKGGSRSGRIRIEKGEYRAGGGELTGETVTVAYGSNRDRERKRQGVRENLEQAQREIVSCKPGDKKISGGTDQGRDEFAAPADPDRSVPGVLEDDYARSFSEFMNNRTAADYDIVYAEDADTEASAAVSDTEDSGCSETDIGFSNIGDLLKFAYLATRRNDFVVCLQSSSMNFENTEDFILYMDRCYEQEPVKFIQILKEGKKSLSLLSGLIPDLKNAVSGFKLRAGNVLIMCDGQYVFKSLTEIMDFDDKLWESCFDEYYIFRRRTERYYGKIADKLKKTDRDRFDKINARYANMFQIDGVIFRDPDDFEFYIRQADSISPDFAREYLITHRNGIIRAIRETKSDPVKEILGRYVVAVNGWF
jgi:serine/threonine protein kinase